MNVVENLTRAVSRAGLALSIHNAQPARWWWDGQRLWLAADEAVRLPQADPESEGIGLSCGAALEAMALALRAEGIASEVEDLWPQVDRRFWPGHRMAARLTLRPGAADPDPLHMRLEARFTWRGPFAAGHVPLFGWNRADAPLVLDVPGRGWLAGMNDAASLRFLHNPEFRRELLGWMRLSPDHPRAGIDGMDLAALRIDRRGARWLGLAFGPLWRGLEALGRVKRLASEAEATQSAQVIALFHRPFGESPVTSGRAYLRMWLEATCLGLAGWPMAALADDPETRQQIVAHYGIGPDRRLVQVIRFGLPAGPMPPRARRPIQEIFRVDRSQLHHA